MNNDAAPQPVSRKTEPEPGRPSDPPNWDKFDQELACPLCGYNLRGLTTPRCPECGYTFDWAKLLDPRWRRHRFLFEHHPQDNVRSFLRTVTATLRPAKFWTSVRPDHPSRPPRLLLYWALANGMTIILTGLWWWAERAVTNHAVLRGLLSFYQSADGVRTRLSGFRFEAMEWPGRVQLVVASIYMEFDGIAKLLLWILGLLLAYVLLLFALLMIFQGSIRQARARPIHVIRCLVYSTDVLIWIGGALLLGVLISAAIRLPRGISQIREDGPLLGGPYVLYAVLILPIAFWMATTWRLHVAYRKYLQFRHALATMLAVQLILLLCVTVAAVVWWCSLWLRT